MCLPIMDPPYTHLGGKGRVMETFGVLLALAGFFVIGAGIWTLVRPFPKGLLTSRARGCLAIFAGLTLTIVGGSLMPPVEPEAETPAPSPAPLAASAGDAVDDAPSPPAESQLQPVGPPAPAFAQTKDDVLAALNRTWREARQPGAFAVDTASEIAGGVNRGGIVTTACASSRTCVLITTNREGRVTSLTMMASHADASGTGTTLLASLAALTVVGDPTAERSEEFRRQLDRVSAGSTMRPRRAGDACVHVSGGQGLGVWTTVSKPPCEG